MTVTGGMLRLQTSGDGDIVDVTEGDYAHDRPRERTISIQVVC